LLKRDISKFNHRRRPETAALIDQKVHSLHGARRVIYEMLANGDGPIAKVDEDRVFISTRDLYHDIHMKCSESALGKALAAIANNGIAIREPCEDPSGKGKDKRKKGFWLPPLNEARRRWCETMKLNDIRWPNDDGVWAPCEDSPPF
jgi:hypothetical protein